MHARAHFAFVAHSIPLPSCHRYFNPVQSEAFAAAYESDVNMVGTCWRNDFYRYLSSLTSFCLRAHAAPLEGECEAAASLLSAATCNSGNMTSALPMEDAGSISSYRIWKDRRFRVGPASPPEQSHYSGWQTVPDPAEGTSKGIVLSSHARTGPGACSGDGYFKQIGIFYTCLSVCLSLMHVTRHTWPESEEGGHKMVATIMMGAGLERAVWWHWTERARAIR